MIEPISNAFQSQIYPLCKYRQRCIKPAAKVRKENNKEYLKKKRNKYAFDSFFNNFLVILTFLIIRKGFRLVKIVLNSLKMICYAILSNLD